MEKETKEFNNVPKIRYPGFTDPWEQRKLGDVTEITMGQSPDGSTYSEESGEHILIQGNADLVNGWVVPRVWTSLVTKKADIGDLIMSVRAPAGAMGKTLYPAVIGRGVAAIKGNEFVFQQLSKMNLEGYWKRIAAGSTFESINGNDLKNAELAFPTEEEQQQIGSFFQKLDDTITLHQRKLDLLKNCKSGMLQKMFPKNGTDIPDVRYPEFTDPWEQRKLGELGEIITGNTPPTSNPELYSPEGILWVTPTDINALVTTDSAKKLSPLGEQVARIVPGDSILCTCIASIGKNTLVKVKSGFNQQINALVPNFERYHPYFLLTDSFNWSSKMSSLAATQTMPIINKTEFSKINTKVPHLAEQRLIGSFFQQLDETITLHQRKLDLLKEYKKGLLQQMFI